MTNIVSLQIFYKNGVWQFIFKCLTVFYYPIIFLAQSSPMKLQYYYYKSDPNKRTVLWIKSLQNTLYFLYGCCVFIKSFFIFCKKFSKIVVFHKFRIKYPLQLEDFYKKIVWYNYIYSNDSIFYLSSICAVLLG